MCTAWPTGKFRVAVTVALLAEPAAVAQAPVMQGWLLLPHRPSMKKLSVVVTGLAGPIQLTVKGIALETAEPAAGVRMVGVGGTSADPLAERPLAATVMVTGWPAGGRVKEVGMVGPVFEYFPGPTRSRTTLPGLIVTIALSNGKPWAPLTWATSTLTLPS
jgi:hypothetical protein